MMQIFVYEYITGGGLRREAPDAAPRGSLLAEGAAMVRAITADFAAIADVQVVCLRDARLPGFSLAGCWMSEVRDAEEELAALRELSTESDYTLLIAPELDGALLRRAREVEAVGGRLLGPSADFIAIASDKHTAAERLRNAGVATPPGFAVDLEALAAGDLPRDLSLPAVLKRRDGAGSQQIWRIETPADLATIVDRARKESPGVAFRLERYVPGLSVSVAVLCGPGESLTLPACRQHLSDDGAFRYLGGELPLDGLLGGLRDMRARKLAEAAVRAIGPARGYVGVDLVLGEAADGSADAVIEVNPRLTTSYVGLRRLARENLAAAMLAVAHGDTPPLSFFSRKVEFSPGAGDFP